MSSGETPVNIAKLLTTFKFHIKALPEKLKCAECKSVLKDACQVPCGCRFCHTCIDGLVARGSQFCPGDSQECCRTPLSTTVPDYRANKSIMKLTAKCPHAGCAHECPLADMDGHLRICTRKTVDCYFSPCQSLSYIQSVEEINNDKQGCGSYSDILIGMVANINRDMKMLKRSDEASKEEIQIIKQEMMQKDQHMKNIENENKSIKREKEVLSERVQQLSEKLEREINDRRQSDKRASAGISALTASVALHTEMEQHISDDIQSVNRNIQSIKSQFDSIKLQMKSMLVAVGLGQLDDWLIDKDIGKTEWGWGHVSSGKFRGEGRPYTYNLESWNIIKRGELGIWLCIWAGPSDAHLQWPFRGAVTITVAHRDNAEKCMRQTRQCQIERPPDNRYNYTRDPFIFMHTTLRETGLDLRRGVRVSCQIVPDAGQ